MSAGPGSINEQIAFLLAASIYLAMSPIFTVVVARELLALQLNGMQFAVPPLIFGLVLAALYIVHVRANAATSGRRDWFIGSREAPSAIWWVPPLAGGIGGLAWRYITLEYGLLSRPNAVASSYFVFGSMSFLVGALIIKGLKNASR